LQEVALQNLPVVFCIDRAGLVGSDGPTHHGLLDIGFLRMMPNMVLIAPADGVELRGSLEFALGHDGPVAIRYPKDFVPESKYVRAASAKPFRLGESVVVKKKKGAAVAIVSYGSVLREALDAARLLDRDGIGAEVINARFAAPIDERIVSAGAEGRCMITVEDHSAACGFGAAVVELAATILKRPLEGPIALLGAPRRFIKHDLRSRQLMEVGVNADKIAERAREMLRLAESP
jgi:1-deoxy-D-xylulose-5-phosphate synthase